MSRYFRSKFLIFYFCARRKISEQHCSQPLVSYHTQVCVDANEGVVKKNHEKVVGHGLPCLCRPEKRIQPTDDHFLRPLDGRLLSALLYVVGASTGKAEH